MKVLEKGEFLHRGRRIPYSLVTSESDDPVLSILVENSIGQVLGLVTGQLYSSFREEYPDGASLDEINFPYLVKDVWIVLISNLPYHLQGIGLGKFLYRYLAKSISKYMGKGFVLCPHDFDKRHEASYVSGEAGTSLMALRLWNSLPNPWIDCDKENADE